MQKNQISVIDAELWIQKHRTSILLNNQRNRYYDKLGFNKSQQADNDKLIVQTKYQNSDFSLNFLVQKTVEQVRNNYINKLLATGIMKLEPSKKHQSLIIYDWDDTLLCTSYLSGFQFLELSVEAKQLMKNLDDYAEKLLQKSLGYGKMFIITNAAKGWVEYSSRLYLPKTNQVLLNEDIKIISARSNHEQEFPGDFHRWKVEAFKSVKKYFDENLITNLICIGDSNIEMDAAHILSKQFRQALVKTIKFRENPRPDELVKQQELVNEKLVEIYANTKNLTIRLERKQ